MYTYTSMRLKIVYGFASWCLLPENTLHVCKKFGI